MKLYLIFKQVKVQNIMTIYTPLTSPDLVYAIMNVVECIIKLIRSALAKFQSKQMCGMLKIICLVDFEL